MGCSQFALTVTSTLPSACELILTCVEEFQFCPQVEACNLNKEGKARSFWMLLYFEQDTIISFFSSGAIQ